VADVSAWEAMAAWYDEKQGDDGDLWHRTLIDPPLIRLVGAVGGRTVLDLACGNGYLARRFARTGARVIGVDASPAIIERAQARERREPLGITYYVGDTSRLDMLDRGTVDVVFCNMALMDIEDAVGTIGQVGRVLRTEGRFVASLSHPCFDIVNASAWVVERMDFTTTVWRKVSRYRQIRSGLVPWRAASGDEEIARTPAYHRPLSWYVRALRSAGLAVTAFEEPEPTEEFLASAAQSASWIAEIPLHCVIEARKDG
jgi:ubiquinone/menaquinone biosynthesis C-methylase UbiE